MTTLINQTIKATTAILFAIVAIACTGRTEDPVPVHQNGLCPISDVEEYLRHDDICWRTRVDLSSESDCWTTVRETIDENGNVTEPWAQLCGIECAFYYLDDVLVADPRCDGQIPDRPTQ